VTDPILASQIPEGPEPSRKARVPAVYLTSANSLFLLFLPFSRISKLRGISGAQNSDSPRLQNSNCCVINGLRSISGVHVPLVSNANGSALLFETEDTSHHPPFTDISLPGSCNVDVAAEVPSVPQANISNLFVTDGNNSVSGIMALSPIPVAPPSSIR
jgi:hypothetical protein